MFLPIMFGLYVSKIIEKNLEILIHIAVLDPRIGYKGLLLDHEHEPDLLTLINARKEELQAHYDTFYSSKILPPSTTSVVPGSPVKNDYSHYTARYSRRPADNRNELQEFFTLIPEDFSTCDL